MKDAPSHAPARRDDNWAHSGKQNITVRRDEAHAVQISPGEKHKAMSSNASSSSSSSSSMWSSTAKLSCDSAFSKRPNQTNVTPVGGKRQSVSLAPAVPGIAKGNTAPPFPRVMTYSSVIAGMSGALAEAPKQPPPVGPTSQSPEEQNQMDGEEMRKGVKGTKRQDGEEAGPKRKEAQRGTLPVELVGDDATRDAPASNDGCTIAKFVQFEGGVDDWKPIIHRVVKWGGIKLINMKNVLAKTPLVFSTPTACKAMSLSFDGQVTLKPNLSTPRVFDPDCLQGHV